MRNLTVPVFQNGLKAKFGDQYDLSSLTDKDIIEAVQEYKFDQTESIFRQSVAQWDNLKDRALQEKADLIQFAETGVPVDTLARVRNGHSGHRRASSSQGQEHEDSLLREHSRGDAVGSLQAQLQLLGYTDMHGRPLAIDNDFGPSTKAAVESFQRDHGLPADGVVGPNTRKALQEHARVFIPSHTQDYERPARLDDSSHPDHGFYLRTRELVYRLDQSNGRTPDVRSDQLAAALTVEARSAGLCRIDQIALSEDAAKVWAAQRPPGARDHFFDRLCSVDTVQALNTPMELSGAQWPHAMQQFQQHQEQSRAQQQEQQAHVQAAEQGAGMSR